ncbi:malto-oligosyltrehalose trehalohydrolase [Mesobaculum littorinae]|uniref:Malto-oligosyltrehalose trehalohydrolase n=1 Tax=Mesobaculum littorinae TaxID=2486419 RepID=A0A438AIJ0_9RHOB|nr:malto-oligosyltrehalose trehalohydrolase [Mesobaculum littorinae]RVV98458.1 malto-oligosyltrehalose trehalohydrolase [Mesobaculum littorinae]
MTIDPADTAPRTDARPLWGLWPAGPGRWSYRVWAPRAARAELEVGGSRHPMQRDDDGLWEVSFAAEEGTVYRLVLDGTATPDPAARRQAGDVHAASVILDPRGAHAWQADWHGRPWEEAVIYEMHLGTFTEGGTFAAAMDELDRLAGLGITAIEIMPVAQFPGDRGWGYDGVNPYALHPAYGTRDEMRAFVDAAQARGMMVLLDVVYNHFGPDGAYIHGVAPEFFDAGRDTPWGRAIAFAKPAVRRYFIDNAIEWIREFRLDGLRLDAVHQIADDSDPHFLVELGQAVRKLDLGRPIHLVNEDERNLRRYRDGPDPDFAAEWNDDYHHAVHCLLTGESESYYENFAQDPMADLVTAMADGYVEHGQPRHSGEVRGEPAGDLPTTAFVNANQTHDQVGNRAQGDRLITLADPEAVKVAHGLLLLSPFIPMLFMGEEIGATAPFQFFADFHGKLAEATRKGRADEFARFSSFEGDVPDPMAWDTFARSRPFADPPAHAADWAALTERLLDLRAQHVVPLLKSGRDGRAQVDRTGAKSLVAAWPFAAGTLRLAVSLGAAPDRVPEIPDPFFTMGDPARDALSLTATVEHSE